MAARGTRSSRFARTVVPIGLGVAMSAGLLAVVQGRDDDQPVRAAGARATDSPRAHDLLRWAHVRRATLARARPAAGSRPVGRLKTRTPDRTPEVVLLTARTRAADGRTWVRARLPVRPGGRTGWLPRSALGPTHPVRTRLRIDREAFRAVLYRRGRPVWRARIGVGTRANPTPAGRYYVRSRILPIDRSGRYGAFAFGTSAFSPGLSDWPGGGIVGIHGTDEPQLLPGRVSHGCVRLRNRDITRLRRLMPLGTPIEIV